MRRINLFVLALVAIYLLAAFLASGQGGNPPASTKESGATSSKGMTTVKQTGKGGNVEEQIKALHEQGRHAALSGDSQRVRHRVLKTQLTEPILLDRGFFAN